MDIDNELYKIYKKLRNKIRQTKLDDSLYVIWSYIAHLNERKNTFEGIEVSEEFLKRKGFQKRILLSEWDLHILLRETIIHSPEKTYRKKSFRKSNYFADTVNLIKEDITGFISEKYITKDNPKGIETELSRIAHRQFPHQTKNPNVAYITRYYKIFCGNQLKELFENKLKISTEKFCLTVFILYGFFLDKIAMDYPPKIEIPDITMDDIENVLSFVCLPLKELRDVYIRHHKINEDFCYILDQNEIYPLIRMEYFGKDRLVCPDSTTLFRRVTDGLYYELYKEKDFDNKFGKSFEQYVGEVIKKIENNSLLAIPEYEYGSSHNKRKTPDWLVIKNNSILFVECKTKRMKNESKTRMSDSISLDEDLNKMSDFVIQIYKRIKDYKEGLFKRNKPDSNTQIYPLVVTLEDWYVFGFTYERVEELVRKKIIENQLPLSYLEEMPFTICPVDSFETLMQVIRTKEISEVMIKNTTGEEKKWDLANVLAKYFKEDASSTSFLFEEDFQNLLPKRFKD